MLQSSVSVQGLVSKEPIWKVGGGGRGKERRGEEGGGAAYIHTSASNTLTL